jgi:hypothetical protein
MEGRSSALMSHNESHARQDCRGAEHELWLAMQAAYERYTRASDALDALTLDVSGVIPIRNNSLETHRAAAERQAAFESYVEARLEFSEAFLSGATTPGTRNNSANSVPIHRQDTSAGLRFGLKSRLWIVGACILTLCSAVLSMAYLMRHPGSSDFNMTNARKETQFARQQPQSASALRFPLRLNVGESQPGSQTYLARGEEMRASAQNQEERQIRNPRERTGNLPVDLSSRARPEITAQRAGSKKRRRRVLFPNHQQQHYYLFTLSPSNGYLRTGPLRLAVRSVNLKHSSFDLSVLLNGSRLDEKHVRLYERVRIELGDPKVHAELVASWIAKNRVHGYIIVPERQKSELTAMDPRIKRSASYPFAPQASE